MKNIMKALQYLNNLHQIKRVGPNLFAGIKSDDCKSVAEHSYITAYMCLIFGKMIDGINEKKVAAEGMIHDWGEGIVGDWPTGSPSYKTYFEEDVRYIVKKAEKKALEEVLSDLNLELPNLNEEEWELLGFCDLYARIIEIIDLKQKGYKHAWIDLMFKTQIALLEKFKYGFVPELIELTKDLFEKGYMENFYLTKATREDY